MTSYKVLNAALRVMQSQVNQGEDPDSAASDCATRFNLSDEEESILIDMYYGAEALEAELAQ